MTRSNQSSPRTLFPLFTLSPSLYTPRSAYTPYDICSQISYQNIRHIKQAPCTVSVALALHRNETIRCNIARDRKRQTSHSLVPVSHSASHAAVASQHDVTAQLGVTTLGKTHAARLQQTNFRSCLLDALLPALANHFNLGGIISIALR